MNNFYINQAAKHTEYKALINRIASDLELEAVVAPVKGYARCEEKVANDYNGDWTQIKDILRSTIVVKTRQEIERLVNYLDDNFTIVKALSLFGDTETGYNGGNYVIMYDGCMVEIQFNTPINLAAKDSFDFGMESIKAAQQQIKSLGLEVGLGHKYYEVIRTAQTNFQRNTATQLSKKYYNICRMA